MERSLYHPSLLTRSSFTPRKSISTRMLQFSLIFIQAPCLKRAAKVNILFCTNILHTLVMLKESRGFIYCINIKLKLIAFSLIFIQAPCLKRAAKVSIVFCTNILREVVTLKESRGSYKSIRIGKHKVKVNYFQW